MTSGRDYVSPKLLSMEELQVQIARCLAHKRQCEASFDFVHAKLAEDRMNDLLDDLNRRRGLR